MSESIEYDLVVIGGGPAGMSAALIAGRALLNAAIVNAETPRNAVTTASHGFLTRDGAHPTELLAVAKQQLTKYETVRYVNDTVSTATSTPSGFDHGFLLSPCGIGRISEVQRVVHLPSAPRGKIFGWLAADSP